MTHTTDAHIHVQPQAHQHTCARKHTYSTCTNTHVHAYTHTHLYRHWLGYMPTEVGTGKAKILIYRVRGYLEYFWNLSTGVSTVRYGKWIYDPKFPHYWSEHLRDKVFGANTIASNFAMISNCSCSKCLLSTWSSFLILTCSKNQTSILIMTARLLILTFGRNFESYTLLGKAVPVAFLEKHWCRSNNKTAVFKPWVRNKLVLRRSSR